MMNVTNDLKIRRFILAGIMLTVCIGIMFTGVGGGIPTPTDICTPSNQLCQQVQFDQVVYGNSSSSQAVLTSTVWTATLNETLVLIADSNIGGVITSITDTGSDSFTRQIRISQNCPPCQNYEIWTAKTNALTGTVSAVTVTWNATTNNVFVMASYLNVFKIGNVTTTQGTATSGSLSIMPIYSGSKIVGGTGLSPTINVCNTLVPGTFLTQRRDSCSRAIVLSEVEVDVADNMTVLRNSQAFTYSESWPGQGSAGFQMGAIELLGFDQEPAFPNFNNFCTTTNGLCVTTQYKMNAVALATGVNQLNKGLALNTAYCTGITTAALTTTTGSIEMWGNYGGVALNNTGAKLLIQFYVSTGAPSSTFGAGLCSSTGQAVKGTADLYFPVSGALSSANSFSVAVNGYCSTCGAGTWYGWFEITPQNFAIGSLGFDQVTNQPYSIGSINMMEIK
jgi:hypothetical protein